MNRIEEELLIQGVTKADLAKRINKSRATITLYSKNTVQPPLDVLFEIAKTLHIDPRTLIKVD
jgi:transcriptional regulator with XRE-family HTH domain